MAFTTQVTIPARRPRRSLLTRARPRVYAPCPRAARMSIAVRAVQAIALNGGLFALTRGRQRVLTPAGLRHAAALGTLLWCALSWQGYALCFGFLVLGSAVTRVGRERKEALGIAEARGGARGPANLWGAAAVGAMCATAALVLEVFAPNMAFARSVLLLSYTASLATKFSDTTASEIGKAYGKTTYLVTTLRRVASGTEGAVSLEGTVAGAVASLLAGLYGLSVGLVASWEGVAIVVVAAFIATTAESFIGATVQERRGWSNEFVNFLNTAIGAGVAAALAIGMRGCGL